MNPRYAAYFAVHGKQPNWCYMNFILSMKSKFIGDIYKPIQDHDAFTKFIEENASRYNREGV